MPNRPSPPSHPLPILKPITPIPFIILFSTFTALLHHSTAQEIPITAREKNDLEFAKKILSDHYIAPETLRQALTSLRMQTFLRSLRGAAFIRRFATRTASLAPILTMLPKEIAYFRPRAFDNSFPPHAIRRLQIWRSGHISGLIIDLRGLQGGAPTETYAKILAILDGKGDASLQWDKNKIYVRIDPIPEIIPTRILVSEHTSGLYETIVHVLQSPHNQVIGQPTPGRAAAFKEFAMPSGDFISIATHPILWRNRPIPFGNPLIPHQSIDTSLSQLAQSLHLIETGQARRLFLYSTKETLNNDPSSPSPTPSPIEDQALLMAWDSLRALDLIKQQTQINPDAATTPKPLLPTSAPSP
jgi:hypothetical protein